MLQRFFLQRSLCFQLRLRNRLFQTILIISHLKTRRKDKIFRLKITHKLSIKQNRLHIYINIYMYIHVFNLCGKYTLFKRNVTTCQLIQAQECFFGFCFIPRYQAITFYPIPCWLTFIKVPFSIELLKIHSFLFLMIFPWKSRLKCCHQFGLETRRDTYDMLCPLILIYVYIYICIYILLYMCIFHWQWVENGCYFINISIRFWVHVKTHKSAEHKMFIIVSGMIFLHALSQWRTKLRSNVVSHWLGAYPKWSLNSIY